MGSSVSKAKTSNIQSNASRKSDFLTTFSSSTASSNGTLVEEKILFDPAVDTNKQDPIKKRSSILPNHQFFNQILGNKQKKDTRHLQRQPVLSLRKKPNHRNKRKKPAVTKSIIGKPTNFKHLTSARGQLIVDDLNEDEAALLATQMIAVASLIKPLATHEGSQEKPKSPPMIPPRTSSYSNPSYLQDFPTPPFRQKKKPVSSLKKPMKTEIKYASINKSSVGRTKRVQRDNNIPRQKRN